jgi:hypothetical protein
MYIKQQAYVFTELILLPTHTENNNYPSCICPGYMYNFLLVFRRQGQCWWWRPRWWWWCRTTNARWRNRGQEQSSGTRGSWRVILRGDAAAAINWKQTSIRKIFKY